MIKCHTLLLNCKFAFASALMFCVGPSPLRTASFRSHSGKISAKEIALPSIQRHSHLFKTLLTLHALKSSRSIHSCAKYFNYTINFQNIPDVRNCFGLLPYAFSMKTMNSFQQLLKHNTPFEYTTELDNPLRISKRLSFYRL